MILDISYSAFQQIFSDRPETIPSNLVGRNGLCRDVGKTIYYLYQQYRPHA